MAGYNRIVLVGNLTRDPDYKQLASGQPVCRLGLASNRQYRNRQSGDMVQEVCFIDIDVWGPQAESCRQYLQKGRQVLIEGRLKFDTWEDQTSGQTRSKHSVVADRVVFLSTQDSYSDAQQDDSNQLDPNNPAERDIMNQIEGIKSKMSGAKKADKAPAAKVESKASPAGEFAFKDEPPFQDDLPF